MFWWQELQTCSPQNGFFLHLKTISPGDSLVKPTVHQKKLIQKYHIYNFSQSHFLEFRVLYRGSFKENKNKPKCFHVSTKHRNLDTAFYKMFLILKCQKLYEAHLLHVYAPHGSSPLQRLTILLPSHSLHF